LLGTKEYLGLVHEQIYCFAGPLAGTCTRNFIKI